MIFETSSAACLFSRNFISIGRKRVGGSWDEVVTAHDVADVRITTLAIFINTNGPYVASNIICAVGSFNRILAVEMSPVKFH